MSDDRKESNVVRLRPVRPSGSMTERMDALDHNQRAIAEALEEIAETQVVTNRLLRKMIRAMRPTDDSSQSSSSSSDGPRNP